MKLHCDRRPFERVDCVTTRRLHAAAAWQHPGSATDRLGDPNRVLIDPDYNSTSGRSIRIIGFSTMAEELITVIVLENDGTEYGVNGWAANEKDRRLYAAGSEGEADEQRG
jgi:hypothetical protein